MAFNGNVIINGPSIINGASINLNDPQTTLVSDLRFQSDTNSNHIEISAPTLAASYSLTLPNSLPTANSFLKTDVFGTLFWDFNGGGGGGGGGGALGGIITGADIQLGTLDNNGLQLITGGGGPNTRLEIDETGIVTIDNLSLTDGVVTVDGNGVLSSVAGTNANINTTFVKRDGVGDFSAGTITANLDGIASGNVNKTGDTMTGTLQLNAGVSFNIRVETLATILLQSDDFMIECTNAGPKILELPDSTSFVGRLFIIANRSNDTLTIRSNSHSSINTGLDTINNNIQNEIILNNNYDRIQLFSNGNNVWYIL